MDKFSCPNWHMGEYWKKFSNKAEVEKMIQCLSPHNVDKQFIYERLDMNKEMQEQFADALQRNTEVMNDLKVQIATLSKTLETIETNIKN